MKDATILTKEQIQDIENIVGYTFNNKALLEQAFIKNDYVNEHKEEQSSEVIEYYGDRALEITVTKELFKLLGKINKNGRYETTVPVDTTFAKITEGTLTNLRNSIVSSTPLNKRIEELGLSKYILFGGKLSKPEIRYDSKIMADLFESICGAIAIDCDWDNEIFEKHILSFLNFENLYEVAINFNSKNAFFENWYYEKFGEIPYYHLERGICCPDEVEGELCIPTNEGNLWYYATGMNESDVISNLYSQAYNQLFVHKEVYRYFPEDITKVLKESWLNPTLDNAINIIQEMEQKGIIQSTKYEFMEGGNTENGDPLWECKLSYAFDENNYGEIIHKYEKTKTEAKKYVAHALVCTLLEKYHYKKP